MHSFFWRSCFIVMYFEYSVAVSITLFPFLFKKGNFHLISRKQTTFGKTLIFQKGNGKVSHVFGLVHIKTKIMFLKCFFHIRSYFVNFVI